MTNLLPLVNRWWPKRFKK